MNEQEILDSIYNTQQVEYSIFTEDFLLDITIDDHIYKKTPTLHFGESVIRIKDKFFRMQYVLPQDGSESYGESFFKDDEPIQFEDVRRSLMYPRTWVRA